MGRTVYTYPEFKTEKFFPYLEILHRKTTQFPRGELISTCYVKCIRYEIEGEVL